MFRMMVRSAYGVLLAAATALAPVAIAAQGEAMGIVVMHGKGGRPNAPHITDFVERLERQGFMVANLEMPWSGSRNYDVPVSRGEEEVAGAVADLRGKGAKKVFIAGHSQGGGFALHFGSKHSADGIIALAPGGNVGGPVFAQKVGDALARARKLVADGKGGEPERLADYEGKRGVYPIVSVPAAWVTWFDPDGAMNIPRAAKAMDPKIPVLFVIPTNDYPALLKSSPGVFRALPKHPLTRLYEPNADHLTVPSASVEEIARWTREVAAAKP
jgi:pimeloyl-ACP methyl ester carboxylesterase